MIYMTCTTPGHNKFYNIDIRQYKHTGRIQYILKGYYGPIGKTGQVAIIYNGYSSDDMYAAYDKLVASKLKKGYVVIRED